MVWTGGVIPGLGDGSFIILENVQPEDFGEYHVRVYDGESFGESDHVQLSQTLLMPRFDYSPDDVNMLDGNPLAVRVRVSGTGETALQWYKDGVAIPGATDPILSFASVSISNSGRYHITARNEPGNRDEPAFPYPVSASPWDQWAWRHPVPAGGTINGVKYLNGNFVAFGNAGLLMLSENGRDWQVPFISKSLDFTDITYHNGKYVAVGSRSGSYAAVSENGTDWIISNPMPAGGERILSGGGVFVSYHLSLRRYVARSTDGLSWTSHEYEATNPPPLFSGTFALGKFVTVGQFGSVIYHSTDGIAWSKYTNAFVGRIFDLNGKIAMLTGNPVNYSESADGLTWSARVPCVNYPYVSYDTNVSTNGSMLSSANGGTVRSTTDGINWRNDELTGPDLNFAWSAVGGGKCVALGRLKFFAHGESFSTLSLMEGKNPVFTYTDAVHVNGIVWCFGNGFQFATSNPDENGVLYSTDGPTGNTRKSAAQGLIPRPSHGTEPDTAGWEYSV